MSPATLLVTSPLFFLHPRHGESCATNVLTNERFARLARPVMEAALFFLEPRTVGDARAAGLGMDAVLAGVDCGVLLREDNPLLPHLRLWEERGWSRAGFLLFSQMDLPYAEPVRPGAGLPELTDYRREVIQGYLREEPYPRWGPRADEGSVPLPLDHHGSPPDLDALLRRRSFRSFSSAAVPWQVLGGVLYEATENVRVASASQAGDDPYFLLNSFYSWLDVRVVVQGVEGVERGVYRYDPLSHALFPVAGAPADDEIAGCIQQQTWIGGGGFCVFVCAWWRRYMWLYRHARAYVNLLIQAGEFSQQCLQAAYARGLGGWVTPAVAETRAARMLGLDDDEDALVFLKLGPPRGPAGRSPDD